MAGPKVIVYSHELPDCPRYKVIFANFEIVIAESEEDFSEKMRSLPADAAVVCFCSASEKDLADVLRLEAIAGAVPLIACCKAAGTDFMRQAAQQGFSRLFFCTQEANKMAELIYDIIRRGGLKEHIQKFWPGSFETSPHVGKLIDEIIHAFPFRLQVQELARRRKRGRGWLLKLCKGAFNRSPCELVRHLWVYQALRLMQHTDLDNTEIALQLAYSDESSMARDFGKELGYSPSEAKQRLMNNTPEELLSQAGKRRTFRRALH